jgi:hypothetical protein
MGLRTGQLQPVLQPVLRREDPVGTKWVRRVDVICDLDRDRLDLAP